METTQHPTSTINSFHVETFSKESENWWDPLGRLRMLHTYNDIRVPFVLNSLLDSVKGLKESNSQSSPLKGLKLLDIGCGGGILTEALAKLGADIVGADASTELITIAKQHASLDNSLKKNLIYEITTIEEYSQKNENKFDAVIISEVIEHIDEKDLFVKHCIKTLKKGGSVFITTFNKTLTSWILGILLYENVFQCIPKGAHQYDMFIAPEEMTELLEKYNCTTKVVTGAFFNPMTSVWSVVESVKLFYLLQAIKK